MPDDTAPQVDKLFERIAALEAQQREWVLDFTSQIAELRQRLGVLQGTSQSGSGAVAIAGVAAGERGAAVGGGVGGHAIVADKGAMVFIDDQPIPMTAVQRGSALGSHLSHAKGRNRYL
jgi:hypothetical protein